MLNKTEVKKIVDQKEEKKVEPKPHHSGKGTKARLNTAAEKMMFGSRYST
jgi:hypothetical protein